MSDLNFTKGCRSTQWRWSGRVVKHYTMVLVFSTVTVAHGMLLCSLHERELRNGSYGNTYRIETPNCATVVSSNLFEKSLLHCTSRSNSHWIQIQAATGGCSDITKINNCLGAHFICPAVQEQTRHWNSTTLVSFVDLQYFIPDGEDTATVCKGYMHMLRSPQYKHCFTPNSPTRMLISDLSTSAPQSRTVLIAPPTTTLIKMSSRLSVLQGTRLSPIALHEPKNPGSTLDRERPNAIQDYQSMSTKTREFPIITMVANLVLALPRTTPEPNLLSSAINRPSYLDQYDQYNPNSVETNDGNEETEFNTNGTGNDVNVQARVGIFIVVLIFFVGICANKKKQRLQHRIEIQPDLGNGYDFGAFNTVNPMFANNPRESADDESCDEVDPTHTSHPPQAAPQYLQPVTPPKPDYAVHSATVGEVLESGMCTPQYEVLSDDGQSSEILSSNPEHKPQESPEYCVPTLFALPKTTSNLAVRDKTPLYDFAAYSVVQAGTADNTHVHSIQGTSISASSPQNSPQGVTQLASTAMIHMCSPANMCSESLYEYDDVVAMNTRAKGSSLDSVDVDMYAVPEACSRENTDLDYAVVNDDDHNIYTSPLVSPRTSLVILEKRASSADYDVGNDEDILEQDDSQQFISRLLGQPSPGAAAVPFHVSASTPAIRLEAGSTTTESGAADGTSDMNTDAQGTSSMSIQNAMGDDASDAMSEDNYDNVYAEPEHVEPCADVSPHTPLIHQESCSGLPHDQRLPNTHTARDHPECVDNGPGAPERHSRDNTYAEPESVEAPEIPTAGVRQWGRTRNRGISKGSGKTKEQLSALLQRVKRKPELQVLPSETALCLTGSIASVYDTATAITEHPGASFIEATAILHHHDTAGCDRFTPFSPPRIAISGTEIRKKLQNLTKADEHVYDVNGISPQQTRRKIEGREVNDGICLGNMIRSDMVSGKAEPQELRKCASLGTEHAAASARDINVDVFVSPIATIGRKIHASETAHASYYEEQSTYSIAAPSPMRFDDESGANVANYNQPSPPDRQLPSSRAVRSQVASAFVGVGLMSNDCADGMCDNSARIKQVFKRDQGNNDYSTADTACDWHASTVDSDDDTYDNAVSFQGSDKIQHTVQLHVQPSQDPLTSDSYDTVAEAAMKETKSETDTLPILCTAPIRFISSSSTCTSPSDNGIIRLDHESVGMDMVALARVQGNPSATTRQRKVTDLDDDCASIAMQVQQSRDTDDKRTPLLYRQATLNIEEETGEFGCETDARNISRAKLLTHDSHDMMRLTAETDAFDKKNPRMSRKTSTSEYRQDTGNTMGGSALCTSERQAENRPSFADMPRQRTSSLECEMDESARGNALCELAESIPVTVLQQNRTRHSNTIAVFVGAPDSGTDMQISQWRHAQNSSTNDSAIGRHASDVEPSICIQNMPRENEPGKKGRRVPPKITPRKPSREDSGCFVNKPSLGPPGIG